MEAEAALELIRPDDWHLHLRDGALLDAVLSYSAAHFGRGIIMPNLSPPLRDCGQVRAYRRRVLAALPAGSDFQPLMTLYLTEATRPEEVAAGYREGLLRGVKLYPAGVTTNSRDGVRELGKVYGVLECMAELGLPLLVHGEVADADCDVFDRERVFIQRVLEPLRRRFAGLRVVLEHITTAEGVAYVQSAGHGLAGTITPHHLMLNRNALFAGGLRPHYYCLPLAKREHHRQALRRAAVSGDARFFLGTDSAPHVDAAKEAAVGCAGIFCAPSALSCLAHVFEEEGALGRLEGFCSLFGAAFYGLPVNKGRIRLVKGARPVELPARVETAVGPVRVFDPGVPLFWRVQALPAG